MNEPSAVILTDGKTVGKRQVIKTYADVVGGKNSKEQKFFLHENTNEKEHVSRIKE